MSGKSIHEANYICRSCDEFLNINRAGHLVGELIENLECNLLGIDVFNGDQKSLDWRNP